MSIRRDHPREQERAGMPNSNRIWITAAIVAAAIVGGIAAYNLTGDRKSTAVQTDSTTTGQNSVPSTPSAAIAIHDRIAPNTQTQSSPQGPTGPLTTKSGGAPASSPQGETPAGMQAAPEGSSEKTVGQTK
jgi:hypothetical protein